MIEFDLTSDKDISNMISDYEPTHVMNIYAEFTYNDSDIIKETKYKLVLTNAITRQKIWEANLNQVLGIIKQANQEKNDVKTVLKELEKQQLLKTL